MATHQTHAHEEKERPAQVKPSGSGAKSERKTHHEWSATNLSADDRKYLERYGEDLSKSTLRAKWIHSTSEHEDHPGQTLATRSHEVIQRWAEERKAAPATLADSDANNPRVLRFDFPGYGGQSLQHIAWDQWFKPFDARHLVFVYQEHLKAGNQSNFFHLDSPEREEG